MGLIFRSSQSQLHDKEMTTHMVINATENQTCALIVDMKGISFYCEVTMHI